MCSGIYLTALKSPENIFSQSVQRAHKIYNTKLNRFWLFDKTDFLFFVFCLSFTGLKWAGEKGDVLYFCVPTELKRYDICVVAYVARPLSIKSDQTTPTQS